MAKLNVNLKAWMTKAPRVDARFWWGAGVGAAAMYVVRAVAPQAADLVFACCAVAGALAWAKLNQKAKVVAA